MIIPVRCFTCGKCLSNKKQYYDKYILKQKMNKKDSDNSNNKNPLILDLNVEEIKKTVAGEAMDDLGLTRICCRKTMLSSIELINEI